MWLVTEAESRAIRSRQCTEDHCAESFSSIVESLLQPEYEDSVLFGLALNNADISTDIRTLTNHVYEQRRRKELAFNPRELERYDRQSTHCIQFLMCALVRQRDQRIAPLYTACLSIMAYSRTLDRFFWDILAQHRILYARSTVAQLVNALSFQLESHEAFESKSWNIGVTVIDNKAYFVKEVHQHVESAHDVGNFFSLLVVHRLSTMSPCLMHQQRHITTCRFLYSALSRSKS